MRTPSVEELTEYLHQQVPLTHAMQVRVVSLTAHSASLSAPLAPNINLHGTGFGGSLATLGIMAGWCVANQAFKAARVEFSLVVKSAHCDFLAPATGPLSAYASIPPQVAERICQALRRQGRARVEVEVSVTSAGGKVLRLQAEYAAV